MTVSRSFRRLLVSLSSIALCLGAYAQEGEVAPPPPIVVVSGQPYIMVTITDEVSDMDAMLAGNRERLLKTAFDRAMKRSKVSYAYSVSFRPRKPEEFVPQLIIEIFDWRFAAGEAAECSIRGTFIDASEVTHHLKGAVGFESTMGMIEASTEVEETLQMAAQKAFERMLKKVLKKGLYVAPPA